MAIKIFFKGEGPGYIIRASNSRYAVCTRQLHRKVDHRLLKERVEMSAFCTIEEAYEFLKTATVYTIIDFDNNVRATDNSRYGVFDYSVQKDCENALEALTNGKLELSWSNKSPFAIKRVIYEKNEVSNS